MQAPFCIIDMGSNGIRFGIVEPLKQNLLVSYEERAPISLLEALNENNCISEETINDVIICLQRFQDICLLSKINGQSIKIIATEATRIASNSKDFL